MNRRNRRALALVVVPWIVALAGCSSSSEAPTPDLEKDGGGNDTSYTEGGDPDVSFDVPLRTDAPETSCRAYDASKIDCAKACANFQSWCDSDAAGCANPYCGKAAECATACGVTKDTTTETNVLFGCAAENGDCSAFRTCNSTKCKG